MFKVDATSPATSTRASRPNSTPYGFNSHTAPLLLSRPAICDGSFPSTRLSTWLEALACSKRTLWPAPMEKLCQFSTAFGLLVTVIWLPWVTMLAWPRATAAPVGRVWACDSPAGAAPASAQASASVSGCGLARRASGRQRAVL